MQQRLIEEIKELTLVGLYFVLWIGTLIVLKELLLAQYGIDFSGLSLALVGALVLAKGVLLLEHVPLGKWVRTQAPWVDVILRTGLYTFGVFVVLVLEKGFDGRHAHGGFLPAITAEFEDVDIYHLWANLICLTGALLVFNVLSVIRDHLGEAGLIGLFLSPPPSKPEARHGE